MLKQSLCFGRSLGKRCQCVARSKSRHPRQGFWERQQTVFFDVRVCHPNAESYADLTPHQIYSKHENEKKRKYAERILQIEQEAFTPLIFITTGGMAPECQKFHSSINCHQKSRGVIKNNEFTESENFLFINKISSSLLTWIPGVSGKDPIWS